VIKQKRKSWARHAACMAEKRGAFRVLVRSPGGRRPLGRSRIRWEDNIKIYLQEEGWRAMDWIDLAQNRDKWRAVVRVEFQVP
jgi:hypothetical protein